MSHTSGHYEIHISVGNTTMTLATRCKAFELPGIVQPQQTAIECDAALSGDTFIVKKIDDGPLRLFEVYPISKCVRFFSLPSDIKDTDQLTTW